MKSEKLNAQVYEVKVEVKNGSKLATRVEVLRFAQAQAVLRGQYKMSRQHPNLSSSQRAGLTSCA